MTHKPNNLAVMIDLETGSLERDCVIFSMGAVAVDLSYRDYYEIETLDIRLDPKQAGRSLDIDTMLFHLASSKEVIHATFFDQSRRYMELPNALIALKDMVSKLRNASDSISFWSKGVDFDLSILDHAYKQSGIHAPWTYRERNCFRTIENRYKNVPCLAPFFTGTPHHTALNDACKQMAALHAATQYSADLEAYKAGIADVDK